MSEASELIAVAVDITGKPSYNGYDTVHEALWNLEEEFKALEFGERMSLSLEVLNDLHCSISSRMFFYTFDQYGDETICALFSGEDLVTPCLEWRWRDLVDTGIMKSIYDMDGLYEHLVKIGELLPEDTITLVH